MLNLKENSAKIIDLGLARHYKEEENIARDVGTLHYSSPEQLIGWYPALSWDMWSCGMILLSMIIGTKIIDELVPPRGLSIYKKIKVLVSIRILFVFM